MTVSGLDDPCPTCKRAAGDHTLREWAACTGTATLDVPYTEPQGTEADAATAQIRDMFKLDPDLIVADHVFLKAITLEGDSGPVKIRLPGLLHEFAVGQMGGKPPLNVAKVAYIGDDGPMRAYADLVKKSVDGAIRAARQRR